MFQMQASERGDGKGQTLSRGLWDQGSGLKTHLLGPVAQPVFTAVVGPPRRGWVHCYSLPPSPVLRPRSCDSGFILGKNV